ncbi:MAG: hypothetical protein ACRDOO_02090 [Actinomadura sp.]
MLVRCADTYSGRYGMLVVLAGIPPADVLGVIVTRMLGEQPPG